MGKFANLSTHGVRSVLENSAAGDDIDTIDVTFDPPSTPSPFQLRYTKN